MDESSSRRPTRRRLSWRHARGDGRGPPLTSGDCQSLPQSLRLESQDPGVGWTAGSPPSGPGPAVTPSDTPVSLSEGRGNGPAAPWDLSCPMRGVHEPAGAKRPFPCPCPGFPPTPQSPPSPRGGPTGAQATLTPIASLSLSLSLSLRLRRRPRGSTLGCALARLDRPRLAPTIALALARRRGAPSPISSAPSVSPVRLRPTP